MGYEISSLIVYGIELDITDQEFEKLDTSYVAGDVSVENLGDSASGPDRYYAFYRPSHKSLNDKYEKFENFSVSELDRDFNHLKAIEKVSEYIKGYKTIGKYDWQVICTGG